MVQPTQSTEEDRRQRAIAALCRRAWFQNTSGATQAAVTERPIEWNWLIETLANLGAAIGGCKILCIAAITEPSRKCVDEAVVTFEISPPGSTPRSQQVTLRNTGEIIEEVDCLPAPTSAPPSAPSSAHA
jgi:hypothetical protein